MPKKRPLLLIAACILMSLLQTFEVHLTPFPPAMIPLSPAQTAAPLALTLTLAPAPTPTSTSAATEIRIPTPLFTPEVPTTGMPASFLLPTFTPQPTDPLDSEDPEGKVLHSDSKRRDETPVPVPSAQYDPCEEQLFRLINKERAKAGVPLLELSTLLSDVARAHSAEMAEHNFFNHANMNGLSFADRMKNAGYKFSAAGENLFAGNGPYDDPEYIVRVWANSPSHRQNMLNPVYTEVGIGYRFKKDSTYGGYFTADFGKP